METTSTTDVNWNNNSSVEHNLYTQSDTQPFASDRENKLCSN
jgi:hypothetical protein